MTPPPGTTTVRTPSRSGSRPARRSDSLLIPSVLPRGERRVRRAASVRRSTSTPEHAPWSASSENTARQRGRATTQRPGWSDVDLAWRRAAPALESKRSERRRRPAQRGSRARDRAGRSRRRTGHAAPLARSVCGRRPRAVARASAVSVASLSAGCSWIGTPWSPRPAQPVGADAVEVADEQRSARARRRERDVEAAVDGDHGRRVRSGGGRRRVVHHRRPRSSGRLARASHVHPSAGITQIRFSGRWRRPPSQPAVACELPVRFASVVPASATSTASGSGEARLVIVTTATRPAITSAIPRIWIGAQVLVEQDERPRHRERGLRDLEQADRPDRDRLLREHDEAVGHRAGQQREADDVRHGVRS